MTSFRWDSKDWWTSFTAHRERPSPELLLDRFLSYDAFTVYHGGRPENPASYERYGLRTTSLKNLNHVARKVFRGGGKPTISDQDLDSAIEEMTTLDEGKLYVVLDKRDLLETAGHYLIYGSEYLCGIAAELRRRTGVDFQHLLKRTGTPTLVEASLRTEDIPSDQLRQLAERLHLVTWDDRIGRDSAPMFDWSFILTNPIPADCIQRIDHPESIRDPLNLGAVYNASVEGGQQDAEAKRGRRHH